jgi:hypothetical protein
MPLATQYSASVKPGRGAPMSVALGADFRNIPRGIRSNQLAIALPNTRAFVPGSLRCAAIAER